MIKAILFDLDGVIIKDPIFSTVYAAEFGLRPENMLPFFTKEFQRCLTGEADLKQVIAPYLQTWKWDGSVDELLHYWFTHHKDIDKDVVQIIKKIRVKGIPCYLATNQEKYRSDYIWNTLQCNQLFSGIFTSCEMGSRKPQRAFFKHIFEQLGAHSPNEIVFVDDSMNDIKEAQNFGFTTIYYSNARDLESKLNQYLHL